MMSFAGSSLGATCEIAKPMLDAKIQSAPKGNPLSPVDPLPGVKYIEPEEAMKHFDDASWVFVDTRPTVLYDQCHIRKSVNHEFANPGNAANQLTKDHLKDAIAKKQTIVFLCNSFECYRSANAAIVSVCEWGMAADKVKWLGKGVPGVVAAHKDSSRKYTEGKNCGDFLK
jgi:rhodanese-related sulfurtransferase